MALYCEESMSSSSSSESSEEESSVSNERFSSANRDARVMKEDKRWNFATYHFRREIGLKVGREERWIKTSIVCSTRASEYMKRIPIHYEYEYDPNRNQPWIAFVRSNRRIRKRVEFRIPVDSSGSTMWISTKLL